MVSVVFLQQDLRVADNPALFHAAKHPHPILVVYIAPQKQGEASRLWAQSSFMCLSQDLARWQIPMMYYQGPIKDLIKLLYEKMSLAGIYVNEFDQSLVDLPCPVYSFYPNRLYFSYDKEYKLCAPFWRACQKTIAPLDPLPIPLFGPCHALTHSFDSHVSSQPVKHQPWAEKIRSSWRIGEQVAQEKWKKFLMYALSSYGETRDIPSVEGTSLLSPHLHFGEISVRQIWGDLQVQEASLGRDKFINELAWREFSYQLRFFYPLLSSRPLQSKYEEFPWNDNPEFEKLWQQGRTGYPLVDAGMRQLWDTGWMHNRVRMITASFLVKNMLIPWQKGEAWFFNTLVDADQAINGTNWQWVAGCGTDSVPYFRIFNPTLQGKRYDPKGVYIKKWIPELGDVPPSFIHEPWTYSSLMYPAPVLDFKNSRTKSLAAFDRLSRKDSQL